MTTEQAIRTNFHGAHNAAFRRLLRQRVAEGLSVLPMARTVGLTASGKAGLEQVEACRVAEARE